MALELIFETLGTYLLFIGGALILGLPFVFLIMFKGRIGFLNRKKYEVWIYQTNPEIMLKEGEKPKDEDLQLIKKSKLWGVKSKKVEYGWLQTGIMQGLKIDASIFACVRSFLDNEQGRINVIRLWQKIPNLEKEGNYFPVDIPEKVSYEEFKDRISGRASHAMAEAEQEAKRPKTDESLIQMLIPIIALIVALVIVILALDSTNKALERATSTYAGVVSSSTTQIISACGGHFPNETQSVNGSGGLNNYQLPFVQK